MTSPSRVAVCGGGVAAIEAVLALRDVMATRPHIDLIAPNKEFVYTPMAVAEPFGLAETRLFDLAAIAEDVGAELHVGSVASLDGENRNLVLGDGRRIAFDAAIIAVGAVRRPWLAGALSFGGASDVDAFTDLLERLERGEATRLAFTAPTGMMWVLPLYELALLTAGYLAENGIVGVELTVVTPEADLLTLFGPTASLMLHDHLSDRGIRLRMGAAVRAFAAGRLDPGVGEPIDVDEVVALPQLEGPYLQGLPCDAEGFIPIDEHCRVLGLESVYAAGDGTTFPIKQGGIAAQQADIAAEAIAAGTGASSPPAVFEPTLRGMLLTGVAPLYLRASTGSDAGGRGEVVGKALWWPPTKVAGRHLGPYLTFAGSLERHISLKDRTASSHLEELGKTSHDETRDLALSLAGADASSGDFASALQWLALIERLDGMLTPSCIRLREEWQARLS